MTIVCAFAGLALGGVYFYLLHRGVRGQATGASGRAFLLHTVLRLVLAALVFWWVAQQGTLPLLGALAGFLAARLAAVRILATT